MVQQIINISMFIPKFTNQPSFYHLHDHIIDS